MKLKNRDLAYTGIDGAISAVGWRTVEWLTEVLYKTNDQVASLLYRGRDALKLANQSGLDVIKPQDAYTVQRIGLENGQRFLSDTIAKRPDLGLSNYLQQVGDMIKGIDTNSISSSLVKDTAGKVANQLEATAFGVDPSVVSLQVLLAGAITVIPTYYTLKCLYYYGKHRKSTQEVPFIEDD
ncbi:MAG TPA: hypothetical protein VJJ76_03840 [archaeon]|nr:hypothetical protein [archaeon]